MKKAPPQLSPPIHENADIHAFQSLARGEATPAEQKRALDWMIRAANTYEVSFHPDSERLSAFAEGRRFVGLQIVKLLNLNLSKLQKD